MDKSIRDIPKKRGRPKVSGRGVGLLVRLQSANLARLDGWIELQPEPLPSRPEAIRRLMDKGLAAESLGSPPHLSDAALDNQIAEQKAKIAEMPEHNEPSPEAALARMDKALAKNDLIKMKNKRTRRKFAKRQ